MGLKVLQILILKRILFECMSERLTDDGYVEYSNDI